ncbi:MAG: helix-turn-helix transcriptional regulator [Lachnospiraceae bacterium]|nr:helix-turn-helix transcriptional regulator [Lachnospiraceae bacterium]
MMNSGDMVLDAVILSIVARNPEGTYGYKITKDVRSKMPDVPESTFYPLLQQMQNDGLLEVYHKDLGGRSRRFYKITDSGLEKLASYQENIMDYVKQANSIISEGVNEGDASGGDAKPASEGVVEEENVMTGAIDPFAVSGDAAEGDGAGEGLFNVPGFEDTETQEYGLGLDMSDYNQITTMEEKLFNSQAELEPNINEVNKEDDKSKAEENGNMADFMAEMKLGAVEEADENTGEKNKTKAKEAKADDGDMGELNSYLDILLEQNKTIRQFKKRKKKVVSQDVLEVTESKDVELNDAFDDLEVIYSEEDELKAKKAKEEAEKAAKEAEEAKAREAEEAAKAAKVESVEAVEKVEKVEKVENAEPKKKAAASTAAKPAAESRPIPPSPGAQRVAATSSNTNKRDGFRSGETSGNVDTLADLLKDTSTNKKRGFFQRRGKKKDEPVKDEPKAEQPAPAPAPAPQPSSPVLDSNNTNGHRIKVVNDPMAPKTTPSDEPSNKRPINHRYTDSRVSSGEASVDTLADLLKEETSTRKRRGFFGTQRKKPAPLENAEKKEDNLSSRTVESSPQPVVSKNVPPRVEPEKPKQSKVVSNDAIIKPDATPVKKTVQPPKDTQEIKPDDGFTINTENASLSDNTMGDGFSIGGADAQGDGLSIGGDGFSGPMEDDPFAINSADGLGIGELDDSGAGMFDMAADSGLGIQEEVAPPAPAPSTPPKPANKPKTTSSVKNDLNGVLKDSTTSRNRRSSVAVQQAQERDEALDNLAELLKSDNSTSRKRFGFGRGGESQKENSNTKSSGPIIREKTEAERKAEAEAAAKRKAEEEARAKKAAEEAKKREEEAKKKAEEERKKAEEAKKKAEEAKKKAEEEKRRKEEETKRQADEVRRKREEEKKKQQQDSLAAFKARLQQEHLIKDGDDK